MKYTITRLVGKRAALVRTPNGTKYHTFVGKPIRINTEGSEGSEVTSMLARRAADVDWFREQSTKFSVVEGWGAEAAPVAATVEAAEPEPVKTKVTRKTGKSTKARKRRTGGFNYDI